MKKLILVSFFCAISSVYGIREASAGPTITSRMLVEISNQIERELDRRFFEARSPLLSSCVERKKREYCNGFDRPGYDFSPTTSENGILRCVTESGHYEGAREGTAFERAAEEACALEADEGAMRSLAD
jgi:hypothetical protein